MHEILPEALLRLGLPRSTGNAHILQSTRRSTKLFGEPTILLHTLTNLLRGAVRR